jgi:hypothetical protein
MIVHAIVWGRIWDFRKSWRPDPILERPGSNVIFSWKPMMLLFKHPDIIQNRGSNPSLTVERGYVAQPQQLMLPRARA